jgi:hypothetical protein
MDLVESLALLGVLVMLGWVVVEIVRRDPPAAGEIARDAEAFARREVAPPACGVAGDRRPTLGLPEGRSPAAPVQGDVAVEAFRNAVVAP